VGTRDTNCGTKDTHINFGEKLDSIDWNEADLHCKKADLVIVAGTSMSLRHITHFPFYAQRNNFGNTSERGKVVIVNLQETPDDDIADLRIFAKTDIVHEGIMARLSLSLDPIPVWRPRDALPINKIPKNVCTYYVQKARDLELVAQMREAEALERSVKEVEIGKEKGKDKGKDKGKEKAVESKFVYPELIIGNTHQKKPSTDSDNCHHWTVYVRSSNPKQNLDEFVEKVTFKLHPTFVPKTLSLERSPFEIERVGWGTFDIGISVHWKNGKESKYNHPLSFSKDNTYDVKSAVIDNS